MNAKSTYWMYIVIVLYVLFRLVSSPIFEALSSSVLFGLALILASKCVGGDRTWSSVVSWWKTHIVYSTVTVIMSLSIGVLMLRSDRSMIQIALDVVMFVACYWVLACAHSRFVSRWFK